MFVNVVVRGNCYPYRDILNQTYGLRWHKTRKAYTGEVDIRGRKIKNLEKLNLFLMAGVDSRRCKKYA